MSLATQLSSPADHRIAWSHRDIPLAYSRHSRGRVAFSPAPQSIAVESDLEARIAHWLIAQPGLLALLSQPFTLSYVDVGHRRRYTPDLLTVFAQVPRQLERLGFERWTVIEVKPEAVFASHASAIAARLQAVHAALGLKTVCLGESVLADRRH